MASTGALIMLISQFQKSKKAIHISSIGIVLGSIGLLLSAWPRRPTMSFSHYAEVPWLGMIVAMAGFLLMFAGYVYNVRIFRRFLLSVAVVIPLYVATPVMMVSNGLTLIGRNGHGIYYFAVFSAVGHLLILLGIAIREMGALKMFQEPKTIETKIRLSQ